MSDRKMCDQCGAIMPSGDTYDICEACERSHDEWVNPKTGHGADCGCISCHLSQAQ